MAKELGRYDSIYQMFVRNPQDPDLNHLRLLRKLAEQGKFGPKPFSMPRGDYFFLLTNSEIGAYVRQEARKNTQSLGITKGEALMRHIAQFGDY